MEKQQIVEQIKEINQVENEKQHQTKIEAFINSLTFELQAFAMAFYIKTAGAKTNKGDILSNWFSKNEEAIKNLSLENLLKEVNAFL